ICVLSSMSVGDTTRTPGHFSPAVLFLGTCFDATDWVALLLKNYQTGRVLQRIASRSSAASVRTQNWLQVMNGLGFNVYVGLNSLKARSRSRSRNSIATVRHIFLEADRNGGGVLDVIERRPDLPSPSYILHSSPDRIHFFWRVLGFEAGYVE